MGKAKKIYRIRNVYHEIEGEYSERQLLQRIKNGKYAGSEEIASPPFTSWKKISAEPAFYDAFLNRILGTPEADPIDPTTQRGPKTQDIKIASLEDGTRQDAAKTEHVLEKEFEQIPELKTKQNAEGIKGGATLHQSDIERLFEKSSASASATLPKDEPLSDLKFDESADPKVNLSQPLDFSPPLSQKPGPKKSEKRRLFLLVTLLVGLLAVLFHSGKETEDSVSQPREEASREADAKDSSPESRKENLEALVEEAKSFYVSDTPVFYRGARDLMREALRYEEKNVTALGILALSNAHLLESISKEKDKDAVLAELKKTIETGREVEPHNSNFYRAEAIQFLRQDDLVKAKEKLAAAKEADPTDPENSLVQAEIQMNSEDLEGARVSLQETLSVAKWSVRAHHLNARVFFLTDKMEIAKNEAGEAARLNPLHADSYALVGDILSSNNQLKEAKIFFDLSTRLAQFGTPDVMGHAHVRLGTLKELFGDATARNNYLVARYYSPKTAKELDKKLTGISGSEKEVQEALFESQYDKSYYQDRAKELIKDNKYSEALRFYQALRLLNPSDSTAMVRVGEIMEKLATSYEDFKKIMLLYRRAIEKDRSNPKAYVRLALLETDQYNFEGAFKHLTHAVEVSKEDADVYIALGKHFYKRQDYVQARDYFSRAANINPTDSEVYYYYGLLTRLYKRDLVKEAMRLFSQAYTLDPQNYDALAEWLKLKVQTYEKNFAIKFIRNLMDKEPKNASLVWVFGEVYAENNEHRRAISYYHKALDLDNRSSKVRLSLAKALVATGQKEAAVEEFRLSSRLDPRSAEGFYEASTLLLEMKRLELAEEVINQLIQTTPQYPGAHRLFSKIYQALGKKDQAIAEMQKEVDNNPVNYKFTLEFAELYMGYELFDKAILELQKVTALPSETKAPEFKLERIRAYLLLSRSLRAQSKADNAEGAIKSALGIDPNDPELHRELGYVYHSLQRDREATAAFKFYLSRNPAATDSTSIKTLIQKMGTED